ncbi:DUF3103 family protein [Shewanella woodyi]|uniref:DUF3103 domain-containing protein n=1 Tax=Shewanella woodyi (strain ATCC 51908 / MS32) TaxID=392500 RepID=B1KG30_SHEWM|nr:DUF3103 family protein [Shewanella woodyi]ACA86737.1 conserved hypothetical protein [Shewanella woodyi ATCC 51908]
MKNLSLSLLMLTVPLFTATSYSVNAQPLGLSGSSELQQINQGYSVAEAKREIAIELSRQYTQIAPVLQSNINQYSLTMDADQVFTQSKIDAQTLHQAEVKIRTAKGLSINTKSNTPSSGYRTSDIDNNLVQFRLADVSMLEAWQQGESPLFAFEPDGDDKQWVNIEAYDIDGNIHLLDVYQLPQRPVVVIALDKQSVISEGLAVMRKTFAAGTGPSKAESLTLRHRQSKSLSTSSEDQAISTTVLKRISLQDDQEPWISGKAEIYAIVTGVNPSRDEPVLDIIEMPYLDYSDTQYYPNQIMIHWERYRWAAADLVLMEHDDGTNYKELASALLLAAEQILKAIPDPEVQGFAIIATITNGILAAMPDAWFTNDDDYVDVYYTLQEGETYTNHSGAGGNANAHFAPLTIQPR